jgi:Peptidase family M28
MIDFRLYRIAWLPAVAAFVLMMFSLEGFPEPPSPQIAPATFDGENARGAAREILEAGAERTPGSDGDAAVGDLVLERFDEIEAGTAATQSFQAKVDGEERELTNVVVTLAGESDETVLVMAARDSATGPGAASSAAATAALIELAETLGGAEHAKTLVMVSTDAGTLGAEGARQFLDAYGDRDQIQSAIVLAQPGSDDPGPPHILRHSTDERSTSIGLVRTAEETLEEQSMRPPDDRGFLSDLSRLAFPMAAGEQSVLISEGLDSIAISSAGEKPLPPAEDGEGDLDTDVLAEFGAVALGTILVLDAHAEPPAHGPETYVEFSDSLIPGWAITIFSLSLLLPAGVAALDGVARAARRRAGEIRALGWAFAMALPLAGVLIVILLLGLVGLVADPAYPFDPGLFELGLGEALLLVALVAGCVCGYALTGIGHLPRRPHRGALAPALGAAAVTGALGLWLVNPFLALFLAPAAHAWLLADRPRTRLLLAFAALLTLLPALLALRSSAEAVGAGPWDIVLMVVDGQLPPLALLALCPLAGSLVGLLVILWHPPPMRTDDREPLGSRPQPEWGPGEARPAPASIDSAHDRADV